MSILIKVMKFSKRSENAFNMYVSHRHVITPRLSPPAPENMSIPYRITFFFYLLLSSFFVLMIRLYLIGITCKDNNYSPFHHLPFTIFSAIPVFFYSKTLVFDVLLAKWVKKYLASFTASEGNRLLPITKYCFLFL